MAGVSYADGDVLQRIGQQARCGSERPSRRQYLKQTRDQADPYP